MAAGDVGKAAGAECAQNVEGLGALVVGVDHEVGVAAACIRGEFLPVDVVPPVGGHVTI